MRNLLKLVFVLLLGSQLLACSAAEEVAASCSPAGSCPANGSTIQACCTSVECWYTAGSSTFPCAGTSCTTAASNVVNYCYAKTSSKTETDLATELMLKSAENVQLRKSIDKMYMDLGNEAQQAQ